MLLRTGLAILLSVSCTTLAWGQVPITDSYPCYCSGSGTARYETLSTIFEPVRYQVQYTAGSGSTITTAQPVIVPQPLPPTTARWVAYRPVVPVGSLPTAYYVGRGLIGQPKLYVPGQPVRNALRFLTP